MDPNEAFGPWVKRRRRSLALTQDDLAQRIAYSIVTVRKVESGDLRPSRALADKLAEALEVPAEQRAAFLDFARNEPSSSAPAWADRATPLPSDGNRDEAASPSPGAWRPPCGTVTFVFSDIEDSVRLAQDYPNDMAALLDRHNEILHLAIARHGGYVFQIVGDAFCAAFSRPSDALAAALDAQRGLQQEAWHPAQVKARMGLHTGEAQVSLADGRLEGYTGYESLARTQRVMSVAHGGQVLLSSATTELLRDRLQPGATLRDLGEHRLKGLVNPEHLWQLVAPDIRQAFPPLAALDKVPTNLPVQLTSFIGRGPEIDKIARLLRSERLLTLTGPGGTGKTRLALEVAAHLLDEFPDGVWFVELAPLQDGTLIAQTVASTLGLRGQVGSPLEDAMVDYLQGKLILLILDNCEHLGDAPARLFDRLLRGAPALRILATSRAALEAAGEALYPVPPLSAPQVESRSTAGATPLPALTQYEAVRLLIERGRAVRPGFEVTSANAPAVAEICYHLDGIPLAVELAAARLRSLSPEEIAARLDDRFRLLTGGSRTALPRHQTLRAAIDWSYDLLAALERTALCRLSVFADGFTLAAAEHLCAGGEIHAGDALDLLGHLVDKSLVAQEDEHGVSRYSMLETVRKYAHEKLLEAGEWATARDRHLEHFISVAEAANAQLWGPRQQELMAMFERELDNFRSALEWGVEHRPESGLRLFGALGRYFDSACYWNEGVAWGDRLLARPENSGRTKARATALKYRYDLEPHFPTRFQARPQLEEAMAIYRELGEDDGLAECLYMLARRTLGAGYPVEARSLIMSSIEHYRAANNERGEVRATMVLGDIAMFTGEGEEARAIYRAALERARLLAGPSMVTWLVATLGMIAYGYDRNLAVARASFEECLPVYRELGYKGNVLWMLVSLADVAIREGDLEAAAARLEEAKRVQKEIDPGGRTWPSLRAGLLASAGGDYAGSRDIYRDTVWVARDIGDHVQLAAALEGLAMAWVRLGDAAPAVALVAAAAAFRGQRIQPLFPIEQDDLDAALAEARRVLGEAGFAAAWSQGEALSLDQASEQALSA